MKKYLLVAVLLFLPLVLFAQSRDDVAIYLAPTTGGTPEQQAFFNENFRMELIGANYAVAESQRSADYSMNLKITQEVEDGYEGEAQAIINVLNISLMDNEDGREILQFSWAFESLEDMYEWNLHLIYQAMANVPLTKLTAVPDTNHWRNKWFYACGYVGLDLTFGFYDSGNESSFQNRDYTFYPGPLFALGLEFQFLNFMSAEVEINGSPYDIDSSHSAIMFGLPVLLKFPLKPSRHFMLEPYGGLQFNTSSQASVNPPLFSWIGGFQYGIKAGERGAITIDIRAVGDIGTVKLNPPAKAATLPSNPNPKEYTGIDRFQLQLLIGFKVGFYNRNKDDEAASRTAAATVSDSPNYDEEY
ncbi:MAG: hypothetical protein LBQ46_11065 [Treponema sp.]|jgi:hypothetical protein|nr:hypothetical protein [Treponema sp.]